MNQTRRSYVMTVSGMLASIAMIGFVPSTAGACLVGRWKVRCPNGHDDYVDEVTCKHSCEKCGAKAVSGGDGVVVCPNGHPNRVSTGNRGQRESWLRSYKCRSCGKECCLG
jgi:hypothetical protein